jgi:hypothetical protein
MCNQPKKRNKETSMKTSLALSALVVALFAGSTSSFAQNFGNYPQAYGDALAQPDYILGWIPPYRRFSGYELGYRGYQVLGPTPRRAARAHYRGQMGLPPEHKR